MSPQEIILTGATGFLGGHLVRFFADKGARIGVLVRPGFSDEDVFPDSVQCIPFSPGPALDEALATFKNATLIHCAAYTSRIDSAEGLARETESNLAFPVQVFETCRRAGLTDFINTGSFSEHDATGALHPPNSYAAMKLSFQRYIDFMTERYGVSVATLKLSETYAENDTRAKVIPLLCNALESGERLEMSEGYQQSSFCHVNDIARAFEVTAAHLKTAGARGRHQVFHVNSGVNTSIRDLAALLSKVAAPRRLNVAWGAVPARVPGLQKAWIDGTPPPGWVPRIGLEEGLKMVWLKRILSRDKDEALLKKATDPTLSTTDKEELLLENLRRITVFPRNFVFDVTLGLIKQQRVPEAMKVICHPDMRPMFLGRTNGLINHYGLHLSAQNDLQMMREGLHRSVFDYTDIGHFTEKVLTVCLMHGWLDEVQAFTEMALSTQTVQQDTFLQGYYSRIHQLIALVMAEVPVSRINACVRAMLDHLIVGDREAAQLKSASLLGAMHYAKTSQELADIKVLMAKLVAHYAPASDAPKLTVTTDFHTPRGERLLRHDTDFTERLKQAVRSSRSRQITLIFCSGVYIEYFKIFWAHNQSYLGQVVVVSLDEDAQAWFEGREDLIHVNESIYNGASDFGFYLWRKRFEALQALLEEEIDVCMCGIDSLFYKSAITHFASLPFDIIAGNGPGLPFASVKSHGHALNCDMLFFRATDGVRKLMAEVLDYSGVYLQDQSALNIIAARNGDPVTWSEHEGVRYCSYVSKHGVLLAVASGEFMVRRRDQFERLKDTGRLWVFQPSDKNEILEFASAPTA